MSDVSNLDEQSSDEQDVVEAAKHLDPERLVSLANYAKQLRDEQDVSA